MSDKIGFTYCLDDLNLINQNPLCEQPQRGFFMHKK